MKFTPRTSIGRIKELLASWRPTVSELSHDYRDIRIDFQGFLNRFPVISRTIFLLALLAAGIGVGTGLKLAAEERLAIGHEDYRLTPSHRLYSLNALRERAIEKGASLPVNEKRSYPACSVLSGLDEEL
jgi:hypothetical protein